MKALMFSVSVPQWLALKVLGRASRRLFYSGPLATVRLTDVPIPQLPNDDWVKIQTLVTGFCASDLNLLFLRDSPSASPFTPARLRGAPPGAPASGITGVGAAFLQPTSASTTATNTNSTTLVFIACLHRLGPESDINSPVASLLHTCYSCLKATIGSNCAALVAG